MVRTADGRLRERRRLSAACPAEHDRGVTVGTALARWYDLDPLVQRFEVGPEGRSEVAFVDVGAGEGLAADRVAAALAQRRGEEEASGLNQAGDVTHEQFPRGAVAGRRVRAVGTDHRRVAAVHRTGVAGVHPYECGDLCPGEVFAGGHL